MALLVGSVALLVTACHARRRVGDHDRQHHHDHDRWRGGAVECRSPPTSCPPTHRGGDPRQQHPGHPDPATTAHRGADHHSRAGATRHRRAVRLGRRAPGRLLQEPDARLDRRRQQRHGAGRTECRVDSASPTPACTTCSRGRRSPATSTTPTSACGSWCASPRSEGRQHRLPRDPAEGWRADPDPTPNWARRCRAAACASRPPTPSHVGIRRIGTTVVVTTRRPSQADGALPNSGTPLT